MKKILLLIILSLQFCNYQQKNQHHSIKKIMDVSNYTGNAVAFFVTQRHNDFYSAYIIPISEKDSNVFKKDDFDVFNAIKGQCSITLYIGNNLYDLQSSKYKKKFDKEICNVHADCYVKIWISYHNYVEQISKRKKELKSDSCEIRGLSRGKNGKINEFKILKNVY